MRVQVFLRCAAPPASRYAPGFTYGQEYYDFYHPRAAGTFSRYSAGSNFPNQKFLLILDSANYKFCTNIWHIDRKLRSRKRVWSHILVVLLQAEYRPLFLICRKFQPIENLPHLFSSSPTNYYFLINSCSLYGSPHSEVHGVP